MKRHHVFDISLDMLNEMERGPLYIIIAGGIASGKSHVVRSALTNHTIMDIDDVMETNSWTDYDGEQYKQAMEIISSQINQMMDAQLSMVAMGTCANTSFTIDRLINAKLKGYYTVLVHVQTPVEQCLLQNKHRRDIGKRFVADDMLHKIVASVENSQKTVDIVKNTMLVDFFVHHNNTREI